MTFNIKVTPINLQLTKNLSHVGVLGFTEQHFQERSVVLLFTRKYRCIAFTCCCSGCLTNQPLNFVSRRESPIRSSASLTCELLPSCVCVCTTKRCAVSLVCALRGVVVVNRPGYFASSERSLENRRWFFTREVGAVACGT